ncbi:hypothetical protein ACHAXT_002236 [Thalassiosira profunda]
MTTVTLVAVGLTAPLASASLSGAPPAFVVASRRWANLDAGRRVCVTHAPRIFATPPGKGDFYDDEELFDLLQLHQALTKEENGLLSGGSAQEGDDSIDEQSIAGGIHDWVLETLSEDDSAAKSYPISGVGQNGDPAEASAIPGLHELVLETIADIDSSSSPSAEDDGAPINQLAYDNLQTLLRDKKPGIRAIATDVDGTLLAGQDLHPTTLEAVLKAIKLSESSSSKIQQFFPATGKSRKGAMISLGPTLGPLLDKLPGVFIQGLYCVDGEGNVLFEKKLEATAVRAAEELVKDCGISIVGYDGDDLYTTEQTDVVVHLSEHYGEPTVELIRDENDIAVQLADHAPGCHKLLLMDDDTELLANVVRPKLEELAEEHGAVVTQALPTMLELLPAGCSKAYGVEKVCAALGIDVATQLLALGDAENDAEMLQNAAVGVAVGNACPQARAAADFIMTERHDEGGAGLAMNLFAFE